MAGSYLPAPLLMSHMLNPRRPTPAGSYRDLGASGFIEGFLFVAVHGVGLLDAWKTGTLEWE